MQTNATRLYLPDVVGRGYGSYWNCKTRYRVCKGSRASKKSVTTALMIFGNYGKDTDFNKLLENIELPKGIESVDFNKLINEVLLNKETWKIFKLDNVKVDYVLDDNGKLIKEILTLNLNIDYDLMLTSLDSNLTLKFEINF